MVRDRSGLEDQKEQVEFLELESGGQNNMQISLLLTGTIG